MLIRGGLDLHRDINVEVGLEVGDTFGKITVLDPDSNTRIGEFGAIASAGHYLKVVSSPPGIGVVANTRRRRDGIAGRDGFTSEAAIDFKFTVESDEYDEGGVGSIIALQFYIIDPSFIDYPVKVDRIELTMVKSTKETTETGLPASATLDSTPSIVSPVDPIEINFRVATTKRFTVKVDMKGQSAKKLDLVVLKPFVRASECPEVDRGDIAPAMEAYSDLKYCEDKVRALAQ